LIYTRCTPIFSRERFYFTRSSAPALSTNVNVIVVKYRRVFCPNCRRRQLHFFRLESRTSLNRSGHPNRTRQLPNRYGSAAMKCATLSSPANWKRRTVSCCCRRSAFVARSCWRDLELGQHLATVPIENRFVTIVAMTIASLRPPACPRRAHLRRVCGAP